MSAYVDLAHTGAAYYVNLVLDIFNSCIFKYVSIIFWSVVFSHTLLLSTHSLNPCYWGEQSDRPACSPPASFSVHLVSSTVTPAGSVQKSRGDNMVRL